METFNCELTLIHFELSSACSLYFKFSLQLIPFKFRAARHKETTVIFCLVNPSVNLNLKTPMVSLQLKFTLTCFRTCSCEQLKSESQDCQCSFKYKCFLGIFVGEKMKSRDVNSYIEGNKCWILSFSLWLTLLPFIRIESLQFVEFKVLTLQLRDKD